MLLHTARGLRNQGVADHLHISVETVRTHLRRMFTKLGAVDRAQLVARAFADGYLWVDITGGIHGGQPDTLRQVA